jgi:hypothetical protein
MTKVYVDDTVYTVTVASAASDTTVTTSGSGTSLINTSAGGIHTLNSLTAGSNVTIVDDDAGNLTIAATEDNLSNNDTDDLSEGSTNLYYTDARVDTALTTVAGNIIPVGDNTQYLGSVSKRWHSLYLGPGSLYIDGHKVLGSDASGQIDITTDTDQTLNISAGGSGTDGVIYLSSAGGITTLQDARLDLGPVLNTGTVNIRGVLDVVTRIEMGDTDITNGLINQTQTNQSLELRTSGTGYIHLNSGDAVYIGSPVTSAVKIDPDGIITTTAGNLTISATGSVDVAGHNTTAETATLTATAKAEAIASAESKDAVRATAANTYADAAVAVLTSGASSAFDTLVEIKTLMDSGDATLTASIGALNHDTLSGFVANEHIDWTVTGNTIHADNYTDTNTDTTYTAGTNVSISGSNVISSTDTNTTYTSSDFTHDDLTGFVANEHIDWTTDQGSTNLHAGNYTDTNTVYTDAEAISAVEGESTLDLTGVLTGTTSVLSGSAGGLTAPILELETDNSGWNRPQLMLKDSNGDAASIVGQHHTGGDFYQLNYTMDPNNTHGRTGVTTWAGDYFFGFYKNYSDQSAIKMNLEVYGANDGFNITVLDDYNSGGGNQYTAKPIRLKGEQIELYVDDTGTPFGNFTLALKVKAARSEFFNQVKLSNESSDPSGENGAMYYNTTTNKFRGFQNGAWINLDGT